MQLYMKQKVFSWTDRFTVMDETGTPRYTVEGEFFTLGKKLHIYDMQGREVAYIQEKIFTWLKRFQVEIGGTPVCEIVKEFTFFKPSYRLEGIPWWVEGDFWAHEYAVYGSDTLVMQLSKEWFTWGDSYMLSIPRPEDELPCLCIALAVDCALASEAAAASAST